MLVVSLTVEQVPPDIVAVEWCGFHGMVREML